MSSAMSPEASSVAFPAFFPSQKKEIAPVEHLSYKLNKTGLENRRFHRLSGKTVTYSDIFGGRHSKTPAHDAILASPDNMRCVYLQVNETWRSDLLLPVVMKTMTSYSSSRRSRGLGLPRRFPAVGIRDSDRKLLAEQHHDIRLLFRIKPSVLTPAQQKSFLGELVLWLIHQYYMNISVN